MFRSSPGMKSQYHELTMLVVSEFNEWKVLVVSEFNEWKVLVYAPGVTIHGTRQFSEEKAKEHAVALAASYGREHGRDEDAAVPEWTPTSREDWLVWRS